MATRKKKKSRRSAARYLRKLDPMLTLAATRASEEPESLATLAQAATRDSAPQAVSAPSAVSELPLGACSLAAPMHVSSVRRLAEQDQVAVLVEASEPQKVVDKVGSWKGDCRPVTPTTVLAHVPRARLRTLASMSAVTYVEASVPLRPHNDLAHLSTGLVANGSRQVPMTGKGVLVAVIDTGIDADHAGFKKDGKTRIVNYLDQETGQEFDSAAIDAGDAAASPDVIGHGTHVAGIAAGNGAGSTGHQFQGVAPEADLAIVKTSFQSADIAAGIKHVFDQADDLGVPCVVNLSLGGHFGGHDGTSVTERAIDQMSGPGRLVVASAGNEGSDRIHASTVLSSQGNPRWVADLELKSRVVGNNSMGLLRVQVWHQREDDLLVRLRSPNGELLAAPANGTVDVDRQVFFVQAAHQEASYSGDHSTTFLIATVPQSQWLRGWSLIVEEDRSPGKQGARVGAVHAWIRDGSEGSFTSGSTSSHLVGMPGTAYSAITVGSYASRKQWSSRDPANPRVVLGQINLGDVSYFSSPGPTRDGHNKPEVAGPGQWLISALSSEALEDHVPVWTRLPNIEYAAMQGTSMSAPYVTGALALLLEKDPAIDWAEAKRRLIKSARQDPFTAPCWNERWGYGKIDVHRLLSIEPGIVP